jgi:hypothetical protein
MARILAEKYESSFAPSHSFCRCTTFWRGTGMRALDLEGEKPKGLSLFELSSENV